VDSTRNMVNECPRAGWLWMKNRPLLRLSHFREQETENWSRSAGPTHINCQSQPLFPVPYSLFPVSPLYNQEAMIRFSTAGESHGEALIALISGLPAGVAVDLDFVNRELWRRQQGYGRGGRMKIETDRPTSSPG